MSGYVFDYVFCFFLKIIEKKILEKDFECIEICFSILMNLSIFNINLQETTCDCIFNFFMKFENYMEILKNCNLLTILLNLFLVLERILVVNSKFNSLLAAYFFVYQKIFLRITSFGEDKNKLGVLLFGDLLKNEKKENLEDLLKKKK